MGIVLGKGGGQNCLCVAFLLVKKENTKTKFPGISGKGRDSPATIPG